MFLEPIFLKSTLFPIPLPNLLNYNCHPLHSRPVCISTSFVHRDFSIWRRNPASNAEWVRVATILLAVQLLAFAGEALRLPGLLDGFTMVWPIVLLLFGSVLVVFAITEICKWEELK